MFLTALACAAVVTSLNTVRAAAIPQTARGWTLGEDADTKKNPLVVNEKTLADGRALYKAKCARCHGPAGLGDGPDADPELTDMNLTEPKRAGRNPDGVVFYKVLNGRGRPKMPAFKDELSEEQIWAVVAYVQTLRKK
ncbi:MAG TPA: c-type cytochrome [Vicinamibacterales bacterium]|nr:c-type cytochrome [Vicinamibacterales bacterium]